MRPLRKTFGTRGRLAAAAISFLVVGTLALGGTPASAKVSDGYVRGYNTYVDDWGDEGTLKNGGAYSQSNATCLWQRILWAEGAPKRNGSKYTLADVDGSFGRDTAHATAWLQGRWNLSSIDAWVGEETFGRADNNLKFVSGSTVKGFTLYLRYKGKDHSFSLKRHGNGIYNFPDGDGKRRNAGYEYRTCS